MSKQKEITLLRRAGAIIDKRLIKEFGAQGHHLTGGWENSLIGVVHDAGRATVLTGHAKLYGFYVNEGVDAAKIPYSGLKATGAKHSKYIEGLRAFWQLRGKSPEEALRLAFATAKKQKKEGMPTSGSYRYSSTGKRLRFINITAKAIDKKVDDYISDGLDRIVDDLFRKTKSETI